jgi:Holliday junction resolvasome RuvABC DNA-binding subunit
MSARTETCYNNFYSLVYNALVQVGHQDVDINFPEVVILLEDYLNCMTQASQADIADAATLVIDDTQAAVAPIENAIVTGVNETQASVDSATTAITSAVTSGLSDVTTGFNTAVSGILASLSVAINNIVASITQQQNSISQFIVNQAQASESQNQALVDAVSALVQQTAINADQLTTDIQQFDTDITGALNTLNQTLSSWMQSNPQIANSTTIGGLLGIIAPWLTAVFTAIASNPITEMFQLGQDLQAVYGTENITGDVLNATEGLPDWGKRVLTMLTLPLIMFDFLKTAADIELEQARQQLRISFPFTNLGISEILLSYNRGLIDNAAAATMLSKHGYSTDLQQTLLSASKAVPDVTALFEGNWRGFLTNDQFLTKLSSLGYADSDVNLLQQLSSLVPGVADIITMAYRNVFDPSITSAFGHADEFPEILNDLFAQKGFSNYWALNFWMAHWHLPSPEQGFEMLQRGIITSDQLNTLMKELDILPFWRPLLTQLSYRPITRIDIRRMNSIGLIDQNGMVKALQNLGYSPTDAASVAQFYQVYNDQTSKIGKSKPIALNQVMTLYGEGIIASSDVLAHLKTLNYSDQDAAFLLQEENFKMALAQRKTAIESIVAQASKGQITLDQAQQALAPLGLSQTEYNRALAQIAKIKDARIAVPTEPDLYDLAKAGIINEQQFHDAMALRGYSDTWITALYKLKVSGEPSATA